MNFPALKPLSRQIRRDRKHSRGSEGKGRLPRGIGIERLRDPRAEWSRQFESLGLNPE